MRMRKGCTSTTTLVAVCIMVTAILIGELELSEAQPCNPFVLVQCRSAVTEGDKPSEECCTNLKNQSPQCLCEYLNNPTFAPYVENARKTFTACGVSTAPNC